MIAASRNVSPTLALTFIESPSLFTKVTDILGRKKILVTNTVGYVTIQCNTFSFGELPDYGKMNVIAADNERLTEVDDINLSLLST